MFTKNQKLLVMRFGMMLVLLAGMLGAMPVKPALASTFIVTNAGDLIYAIAAASSGDTIAFHPSLAGQTITLSSVVSVNSKYLILDGSGLFPQVTISGGGTGCLNFNGLSTFDIYDLTISNFACPFNFIADTIISNSTIKDFPGDVIRSIASLTITNSTIMNNGGGVHISSLAGPSTITNSTINENDGYAIISGGSLTVVDSTLNSNSGWAITANGGLLSLINTTIFQNSGGALIVNGINRTTVINSTILQNQGGNVTILINGGGEVDVFNSTIIDNANMVGFLNGAAILSVYNSILACTHPNECFKSQGGYVYEVNSIVGSNGTLEEYGLAELADNGGPTKTMALSGNSPLIDAGDDTVCANEFVNNRDQRGVARPQGVNCDIGAYEYDQILYVKWDASGANNGSSWTDAYTDLQSAFSAASSGDEIWVAAGTYYPTSGTDRTISFSLKNGVAIYGGFVGNETLRTQRNFETNVTILSGDIGVSSDNSDNSYNVVVGNGTNNSAILDGFTITAGNGYEGGGMYNNNGSPSLVNMTFNANSADWGGGMYNYYSEPILTNITFTNNSSGSGTGMFNYSSSPDMLNVTFSNNSGIPGSRGGAMVNDSNSSPNLTNATFVNNSVVYIGGGMMNSYDSNPNLVNVTFVGNSSVDRGGAIYNWDSNPSLKNVTFSGNSSDTGGAIYNDNDSDPIIINSIMYGNIGGEIYNNGESNIPTITYSIVQGGYPGTGNLATDPLLSPLQDNGGYTQTMALGAGSPAINAGDNANCPDTDQRGVTRPQGAGCDIGAYEADSFTITLQSVGAQDGWILESSETSGVGGTMNKTSTLLRVGDNAANKQYRSILSFDIPALPEGADITSVTLKFKYAGKKGTDPFTKFTKYGNLMVDICKGAFKGNSALQLGDFKPIPTCGKNQALIYTNTKVDNWYSQSLNPLDFGFINLDGVTQFRLRFSKDDNHDFGADFLKLYSGNATVEADRPQLIIEYVP